jgi:SAM-dependent methyltransferase
MIASLMRWPTDGGVLGGELLERGSGQVPLERFDQEMTLLYGMLGRAIQRVEEKAAGRRRPKDQVIQPGDLLVDHAPPLLAGLIKDGGSGIETDPEALQDLLDILDVRAGQRVLEVGYGPGGLIRLLVARTEAAQIIGVDPSPAMLDMATGANRAAVRAGRVELRLGTADQTGLAEESVDRVVSVNNVAIWPDLNAGTEELHRVVRPGGTVVLAWHGGTAPSRIARGLRLPTSKLARIERSLRDRFSRVDQRQLASLDVFTATR